MHEVEAAKKQHACGRKGSTRQPARGMDPPRIYFSPAVFSLTVFSLTVLTSFAGAGGDVSADGFSAVLSGAGAGLAAAGLAAGLFGAFLFGPLFQMFAESVLPVEMANSILSSIGSTKGMLVVHGSVWGLLFNIPIFVYVSMKTKPVPEDRKQRYAEVMEGRAKD